MTVLDLSGGEKPRQIQENMIAYMRLFAGLSGITAVDEPDVFWMVSGGRAPGDTIFKTAWQSDDIEERIDGLFANIGKHSDSIDWFVFPGNQPSDLGKRLEARGMPGGPAGNWLWMDLSTMGAAPAVPQNFHIEQVTSDAIMAEWTRLSAEGFGSDVSVFYDAYARHGYGEAAFSLHYIGYLDNIPVTSGTLLDAGNTATIYDISTPPKFRGQGFGGAITYALMQEIQRRGYADTWIWASNMAKSLYQSLGYVDADFGIREHSWKKS